MAGARTRWGGWLLCWAALWLLTAAAGEPDYPEQDEVNALLTGPPPGGVLFLVMEYDGDALGWVLPRLLRYVGQIRAHQPELPLAVLSHGEEMMGLLQEWALLYPALHTQTRQLVEEYDVSFHVCGSYAAMANRSPGEFPEYVDVVPSGTAQIADYRALEFRVVSLEQTW